MPAPFMFLVMRLALRLILAIGLFGMSFSGVPSYQELFGDATTTCPSPGAPGTFFDLPACVYGFFMYLLVVVAAAGGLLAGRRERGPSCRADPTPRASTNTLRARDRGTARARRVRTTIPLSCDATRPTP
jgi:hypothetical protein